MRILGLDASTTTIGIAVLEYDNSENISLIYHNYYKPDKSDGLINMLIKTRIFIKDIAYKYSIDEFVIEDYIKFMKGNSSAGTIIPLALLNITLRLMIIDEFNIEPQALNVLKIRHALKINNILPSKEEIPSLVAKHLCIKYPWLYKINKKTKQEVIMTESYDVADAIAVALSYIILKFKQVKKKTTKKKTTKKKTTKKKIKT